MNCGFSIVVACVVSVAKMLVAGSGDYSDGHFYYELEEGFH